MEFQNSKGEKKITFTADIARLVKVESVFTAIRSNILVDLRSWAVDAYSTVASPAFTWLEESQSEFILLIVRPYFQRIQISTEIENGVFNQIFMIFAQLEASGNFAGIEEATYKMNMRKSLGEALIAVGEVSEVNFEFLTSARFDLTGSQPFGLFKVNQAAMISIFFNHFNRIDSAAFDFSSITALELGVILEFALRSELWVRVANLGGLSVSQTLSNSLIETFSVKVVK